MLDARQARAGLRPGERSDWQRDGSVIAAAGAWSVRKLGGNTVAFAG